MTIYFLSDGTPVPRASQVVGDLDLDAMEPDHRRNVQRSATIGTGAHALVEAALLNHAHVLGPHLYDGCEYQPANEQEADWMLGRTAKAAASWVAWHALNGPIKPWLVEVPLVHEELGYGGTCDLLFEREGQTVMCDWKTGSHYPHAWEQQAAYGELARFNLGRQPDEYRLVYLDKKEGRTVKERIRWEHKPGLEVIKTYTLTLEGVETSSREYQRETMGQARSGFFRKLALHHFNTQRERENGTSGSI